MSAPRDRRPSAAKRGYGRKWREARAAFLARPENRFCACGCGQEADVVDHKVAHKGDMKLFWDRKNWQPMNARCNARKAALNEGAFGNEAQPERPYPTPGCDATGAPADPNHWWNNGG
jgi:5-methylcytosine-specific restriction endonuclease McrA